ncbi:MULTISPECIES: ABC transporter permease [Myxococcus]|uniref:ABC transporter, permease protein n=1 Tax=Myxococcus xanthus (strain DK1622) TaxID=246197 RepID=Q1D620_MYXXD|nr:MULTISPECIES: ABC transporter permease [Myxococcus]ABF91322.1 putative ABC transporter, permease protein [Myxococcus xanthus DK 1622]NOJ57761.1 ABC transporter permease [Myxococcus xanthus]NOK05533.1 ABC transporter permease [Myxococcus xanthus]QPM83111.1 ABC transporter permease [Myxococcus xanthus]QQR47983.1 ABC transporter permease [Myxococcus xanthus]
MTTQTPSKPAREPGPFTQAVTRFGQGLIDIVSTLGGIITMGLDVFRWSVRRPFRLVNLFAQLDFVGVGSIFIVSLTGTFTGMVFALQTSTAFQLFDAESLVGPTVALTLTRELAAVFSALMVTMRAGSAMCTELGTMRVTEQVDALETMAVNPVQYLLVPRVLAGLFMVPALTMLFNTMGMGGAYVVAVGGLGISPGTFLSRTQQWLAPEDIFQGLLKGAVFGLSVSLICCFKGFNASGGAKGVGQATTEAMVASALSIFILDFILGILFF